jgi:peptidoglycan/LPS O-acetylase OafA/YrhL
MKQTSPTATSAPRVRLRYVPALDGVRGIALLVMLAYHAELPVPGGAYLAVSTFFTLSGFLITSLLLVEGDVSGRIDMLAFWGRRLRRLLPASFLGVVLAAVFIAMAGTPSQLARFRWDSLSVFGYFSNIHFMMSSHSYWEIFSRPSPLQHYWSLSMEEQFYLFYPGLLMLAGALTTAKRSRLRILLGVLALASIDRKSVV